MPPVVAAAMAAERERRAQLAGMLEADPVGFILALPDVLGPALAQVIAGAVADVFRQVPVRVAGVLCSVCLGQRVQWETRNEAAMRAALELIRVQVGAVDLADPRVQGTDLTPFLPDRLRPGAPDGLPVLRERVTTVGGNDVCPVHHPAAVGGRPGLLAVTGLSVHQAATFAAGAPVPGFAGR